MMKYILDGRNMATREAAYDEIARALKMPAHFGRNLDALWDELSCMRGEVMLKNASALAALGDYGEKLISTFAQAAEENPRLTFRTDN